VRVYGPDGAKPIRDVKAGDRVYSYVGGRREVHTVTAVWQSVRQPVFAVRTRNRAITASANRPFMRVIKVGDEQVQHWEEAEWPGVPPRLTECLVGGARRLYVPTVCAACTWSGGGSMVIRG
jgi:hypothetical protein